MADGNAKFGLPELRNGMVPAWGGTFRLTRAVGLARARAVLLGEETLDASAAVASGLAIRSVGAGDGVAAAQNIVAELAAYAPKQTVAMVKQMLLAGVGADPKAASLTELLVETVLSHGSTYGSHTACPQSRPETANS